VCRQIWIVVLAGIACGVSAAPASADVIHWHLPGVIDGSFQCDDPDPDPPDVCEFQAEQNEYLLQFFPVGTRVDFDLAIDTQDHCSSPDVGSYDIKEFDITINGVTARGSGYLGRNEHAALGCPGVDSFLSMYVVAGFSGIAPEGQTQLLLGTVEMFLGGGPGDDLPTVPPAGGFYLEPIFHDRLLGGQTFPGSVVPEPSTLVLVLGGLAAAEARRRRLRQRNPKL
jgi:hypothetical protein